MYTIRVSDGVDKVIAKWKKSNPNLFKKYKKIYKELLEHPKTGLGHPEALRGGGDITWSRHITEVEVGHHLLVPLHGGNKVIGDALGVGVHDADPLKARHLVQLVQQLTDAAGLAPVLAVGGGVLRHHDQLFHALTGQPAGFGNAVGHIAAVQRAADAGDGAVVAAVVAAFSDL